MPGQRDAGAVNEVEAATVVRGAPEAVFAHLVSVQTVGAWMGVVQWELLTRPPLAKGARIEETRNVLGKPRTSVLTVERLDPPRALELSRDDGTRLAFMVEPDEAGARVSCRMTPPTSGLTAWLAAPWRRRVAQSRLRSQLAALRSRIERHRM